MLTVTLQHYNFRRLGKDRNLHEKYDIIIGNTISVPFEIHTENRLLFVLLSYKNRLKPLTPQETKFWWREIMVGYFHVINRKVKYG